MNAGLGTMSTKESTVCDKNGWDPQDSVWLTHNFPCKFIPKVCTLVKPLLWFMIGDGK